MAKTPSSGTRQPQASGSQMKAGGKGDASSARKRETLQSLRRDMEDIVARLKQADSLTQQSVKSLNTAFSVLEKRVSEDSHINKAALTLRVDQLSAHLTNVIKQTHSAVAKDLADAKANPSVDRLMQAVKIAETRIAQTETIQAEALSKINRHIAELAKAVDARLTQDAAAHKNKLDGVTEALKTSQATTEKKLSEIERASAEAILKIGERVVAVSNDMRGRAENQSGEIYKKISKVARKTKSEFETQRAELQEYRSKFERRVEGLEETQRNLDSYTDRSIAKLTARIDNLEYGLTSASAPPPADNSEARPVFHAPQFDDPFANQPEPEPRGPLVLEIVPPAPQSIPTPTELATAALRSPAQDAAPQRQTQPHGQHQAPTPEPRLPHAQPQTQPQTFTKPSAPMRDSNGAFSPTEYIPTDPADMNMFQVSPSFNKQPEGTSNARADFAGIGGVYDTGSGFAATPQAYVAADTFQYIAPEDIAAEDLPYEDPAYAEHPEDAGLQRPGSFKTKKKAPKTKAKTKIKSGDAPKMKRPGRKVQAAGLTLLLVTAGYAALRGASQPTTQTVDTGNLGVLVEDGTVMTPVASMSDQASLESQTAADISLPAIGDYEDNQGLTGEQIEAGTLQAAVKDGDPVAEFQLGLSQLQSGETEAAIKLIRSSANKGQAAAQYRLAKLYEAGEGVTADASMARQLTERAARNGNRIAMHDLALYYAEGRGDVAVNIKTAAKWFEKAAQRGVVDSQYNLGVLFESGQGLPKNLTEAYVWYSIAAKQGDQFARKHIETLKDQIGKADAARADARAEKFKPIAIDEAANGIFRNVSWSEPQDLKIKSARAQVSETQTLLGQLGFDAGRPDGSMGPKTRSAIISFQRTNGLSQTGEVNQALITQLQKASGA